jgi:hypothetical protein
MSENGIERSMFGPNTEEVAGRWKHLHDIRLQNCRSVLCDRMKVDEDGRNI